MPKKNRKNWLKRKPSFIQEVLGLNPIWTTKCSEFYGKSLLSMPIPYSLSIESFDIALHEIVRARETSKKTNRICVRSFCSWLYTRIHVIRFYYRVRVYAHWQFGTWHIDTAPSVGLTVRTCEATQEMLSQFGQNLLFWITENYARNMLVECTHYFTLTLCYHA
jgi:hypothetical protein